MHVILSNLRSGTLTFARDRARDLGVPFLGDPFGQHSADTILCNQISSAAKNNQLLPAGVIKIYPHDLKHDTELLHAICDRAETLCIVTKKSFDSIVSSHVKAELLLSVLDIKFDQPFTITHTFTVPNSVYSSSYYTVLQNTVELIRLNHRYRCRVKLYWYEDMFESHSKPHRPVLLQNQLPVTDICISHMFDAYTPATLHLGNQ